MKYWVDREVRRGWTKVRKPYRLSSFWKFPSALKVRRDLFGLLLSLSVQNYNHYGMCSWQGCSMRNHFCSSQYPKVILCVNEISERMKTYILAACILISNHQLSGSMKEGFKILVVCVAWWGFVQSTPFARLFSGSQVSLMNFKAAFVVLICLLSKELWKDFRSLVLQTLNSIEDRIS